MAKNIYDIIIVGSGPAGYTAAIYTARANLRTLVVQGQQFGGQLMLTTDVENFPGFEHGVMGPDMMETFERQARRFGPEMRAEDVTKIDFSQRPFAVTVEDSAEPVYARALILATGATALWLGLPNEQRLNGRGVSACATCDGAFFRDKELAVVGGGDTAMEEALFLTRFATKVNLLHRRDSFRASKIMQRRVMEHPKIAVRWNAAVEDVLGDTAVAGVRLRDTATDAITDLPVQGLFIAIGHRPNTELFREAIHLDAQGYVKAIEHTMTNIPGVFAAGDVVDHRYRQAITAAGSGCMAAIDAERWLEEQNDGEK
ncbi:MAG: thioredoxin-disulfide reductase [Ktedonobacterales bacterium]|nr:thioredoxin-disulfide reductase [Ktedonobacterales bacterium]